MNIGRIYIEEVRPRMRKGCRVCGEKPVNRRLRITTGSGRWAKSVIYCTKHGHAKLRDMAEDLDTLSQDLLYG